MFQITMKLELIYTTVDWPFKNASMNASLFQLGEALFVILMNKKLIDIFHDFVCKVSLEPTSGSWRPWWPLTSPWKEPTGLAI